MQIEKIFNIVLMLSSLKNLNHYTFFYSYRKEEEKIRAHFQRLENEKQRIKQHKQEV